MLKIFQDFPRDPELLARFDAVAAAYSASCIFADVMYRTGVMHSSIKPPSRPRPLARRSQCSCLKETWSIP